MISCEWSSVNQEMYWWLFNNWFFCGRDRWRIAVLVYFSGANTPAMADCQQLDGNEYGVGRAVHNWLLVRP